MKKYTIRKVKLFNRKQKLTVVMNNETNEVNLMVDSKDGGVFTHPDARFFVNYCEDCGRMFVTKTSKENKCESCSMIEKMTKQGLEKLLDYIKSFGETACKKTRTKRVKEEEPITDKEETPKKRERTKITERQQKYIDFCKKTKNFVNIKDLKKYIDRTSDMNNYVSSRNPFQIRALFHCVYKEYSVHKIALEFGLAETSVLRYLNHMVAMGLIYKDRGVNVYHVNPTVEVEKDNG